MIIHPTEGAKIHQGITRAKAIQGQQRGLFTFFLPAFVYLWLMAKYEVIAVVSRDFPDFESFMIRSYN